MQLVGLGVGHGDLGPEAEAEDEVVTVVEVQDEPLAAPPDPGQGAAGQDRRPTPPRRGSGVAMRPGWVQRALSTR